MISYRNFAPFTSTKGNIGGFDYTAVRECLKLRLLEKCDKFRSLQAESWTNSSSESVEANNQKRGLFGAVSQVTSRIEIDEFSGKAMRSLVDEIEEIASSLSAINPTENPLLGWKGYGGVPSYDAPLDGFWKLRFTTAADATFRPGKRGPAFTYQIANATAGFLLNCVEFRENPGTLENFRVEVEGVPVSDSRLNLIFRRVVVERKSRLSRLTFPFPDFRAFARLNPFRRRVTTPVSLEVVYIDEDIRIHKTRENNYFIHSRAYQGWDPNVGWTLISVV
jgi:hypothetical protein